MLGDKPTEQWITEYEGSHRHPFNRLCHFVGIPMLSVSLPLFLLLFFYPGIWWLPVSLYVVGWVLQFVGHAFEGRRPEFLRNWRFLLVGLAWWIRAVRGRR
jgi:uncharacterized membrane protein YGL010W